jgi:hypothetical protein
MKLLALAICLLCCGACADHDLKFPRPASHMSYAHWADKSIGSYPEFDIVCNSSGLIVGRVEGIGESWWGYANMGRNDWVHGVTDFGMSEEFETDLAAMDAVEMRVLDKKLCEVRP